MTGRPRTERTPERVRAMFLRELGKRANVSDAARMAKIGRSTVYQWREAEPEFAASWDEAVEQALGLLEAEAWRRAVDGVEEPIVGRVGKDEDGIVTYVRKYSDSLMQTLLKAHRPEKYRERQEVQHSGAVQIEYVNDWREQN